MRAERAALSTAPLAPNAQRPTPHASGRRAQRAGFTLVEMIVAIVLLAIGATAALACISSATRSTAIANEYNQASLLAQQKFAELEAQPDQMTGGDQQGDGGDQYPGFTWHATIEPTDLTEVLKVTMVIEWRSGLGSRSAQFVTYDPNPQNASSANTGSGTMP